LDHQLPALVGRPAHREADGHRPRLHFAAAFDTSLVGTPARLVMVGSREGYVEIPGSASGAVEARRGLLGKRVLLTLDDGGRHTFDYGARSVDEIVPAIGDRRPRRFRQTRRPAGGRASAGGPC